MRSWSEKEKGEMSVFVTKGVSDEEMKNLSVTLVTTILRQQFFTHYSMF